MAVKEKTTEEVETTEKEEVNTNLEKTKGEESAKKEKEKTSQEVETKEAQPQEENSKVDEDVNEENPQSLKPQETKEVNNDLATRKFAEGAKKKEREIFTALGVQSLDEAISLLTEAKKNAEELPKLAAKSICVDLNVRKEYQEDVIDICKGKGLAITEENIKAILSKHKGWCFNPKEEDARTTRNIFEVGAVGGKGQPEDTAEREQVKRLFA